MKGTLAMAANFRHKLALKTVSRDSVGKFETRNHHAYLIDHFVGSGYVRILHTLCLSLNRTLKFINYYLNLFLSLLNISKVSSYET